MTGKPEPFLDESRPQVGHLGSNRSQEETRMSAWMSPAIQNKADLSQAHHHAWGTREDGGGPCHSGTRICSPPHAEQVVEDTVVTQFVFH